MNKNGKNENLLEDDKNRRYKNYPFNQILNIYINNRVSYKKINDIQIKGERASFKQEIYEELSDETGIVVETIKNYAIGKSTPPVNTTLNEYKKFAKIFGCTLSELLPESKEDKDLRLSLLDKIGFNEDVYNILRYKKLNSLFGAPIDTTYLEILRDIILENKFLLIYEKEIDTTMQEILSDKKSANDLKEMSYLQFEQFLKENDIYKLDDMKNHIVRAFERQLDSFLKNKFDSTSK
jgi:transcriptional regulator with XRE-family HTH domain